MIRRVHVGSIHALGGTHYSPEQLAAWMHGRRAQHYRRAMERGETMLVAEDQGRIVGFSSMEANEIRAVFVAPDRAGMGVGAMLLEALEDSARERGVLRLVVYASLNGEAFYQHQGYRRVGQLELRLTNGAMLPAVMMVKGLRRTRRNAAGTSC